ncbi:MAG: hypothetical protein ACD_41C00101G0007 [uncultured bacterium]|nr:MAG: hypothetical protein ACD_41C00101G0007 [uncultured bacterium]HBY74147.1 hypothetical protein [Candidatus Kerfeldbacteria bacterium]
MLTKTRLPTEVKLQKKLHSFSSHLRVHQTKAEELLWRFLRKKQLLGLRFLRQHPIDRYIVDFVCYEIKLIIEVDGGVHLTQKTRDQNRDHILKCYGFTVVRFTNDEVLNNVNSVLKSVQQYSLHPCKGGEPEWWDQSGHR